MDDLSRAFRELKKDIDKWYKLYNSGQKTKQDPGHAEEVVNRCVHALDTLSTALKQCSELEISNNREWQRLLGEIFPYLYRHCNPNSENNPALRGVSDKKLNELKDAYRRSPVYSYEPGLIDMSSLMVPAVAGARCGLGAAGILHGIIEWLSNLFPKPQLQPQPAPKKKAA